MQRFKFRLESVLNHRTVLEEQAMRAFAEVQRDLAACTARIAALELQFRQVVGARSERLDVEEITLRERHLDSLRQQIEQEERIREGLAARLEDERARLVKCRQDRKTVGRLREVALADHRAHMEKLEQDTIDELATLRFKGPDRRDP